MKRGVFWYGGNKSLHKAYESQDIHIRGGCIYTAADVCLYVRTPVLREFRRRFVVASVSAIAVAPPFGSLDGRSRVHWHPV